MNALAVHLKLQNTTFSNPHGLGDARNQSTSNDVAKLCYYAMQNEKFREVAGRKEYETVIFNKNTGMQRTVKWLNTNKLL